MINKFLNRWLEPIILFACGVALWGFMSKLMEPAMATVGPEIFVRLVTKLFLIAAALVFTRIIVRWQYPTIFGFTDTDGGAKKSKFREEWEQVSPTVRVCLAVIVFVGVGLIVSLIINGGY